MCFCTLNYWLFGYEQNDDGQQIAPETGAKDEALKIIQEVMNAIKGWRGMAASLGIAKREMELLGQIL